MTNKPCDIHLLDLFVLPLTTANPVRNSSFLYGKTMAKR